MSTKNARCVYHYIHGKKVFAALDLEQKQILAYSFQDKLYAVGSVLIPGETQLGEFITKLGYSWTARAIKLQGDALRTQIEAEITKQLTVVVGSMTCEKPNIQQIAKQSIDLTGVSPKLMQEPTSAQLEAKAVKQYQAYLDELLELLATQVTRETRGRIRLWGLNGKGEKLGYAVYDAHKRSFSAYQDREQNGIATMARNNWAAAQLNARLNSCMPLIDQALIELKPIATFSNECVAKLLG